MSLFVKNRVLITHVIHVLVWVMACHLVLYLSTRHGFFAKFGA